MRRSVTGGSFSRSKAMDSTTATRSELDASMPAGGGCRLCAARDADADIGRPKGAHGKQESRLMKIAATIALVCALGLCAGAALANGGQVTPWVGPYSAGGGVPCNTFAPLEWICDDLTGFCVPEAGAAWCFQHCTVPVNGKFQAACQSPTVNVGW